MKYDLPKRTIILYRIRAGIMSALIVTAAGAVFGMTLPFFIFTGVTAAVFLSLAIFYVPRLIRSYEITVEKQGITVKYGVFFRCCRILPSTRYVFVQGSTTPLSHLLGLERLSFMAAKVSVSVPELDKNIAHDIIEYTKQVCEDE